MLRIDEFERSFELQKINEDKLSDFCEFMEMALCKQCWLNNYYPNSPRIKPFHTHGGILEILNEIKITHEEFEKWINDLEHGLLHGFMVLFFAYCLHNNKKLLWDSISCLNTKEPRINRITEGDSLVISCLFHDFMRVRNKEPHDKSLIKLSNKLTKCTYSHSDPNEECENDLLVKSDRIELLRYDDFDDWGDRGILKASIEEYGGEDLTSHFFKHVRPVFYKMMKYKNDMWIFHSLEKEFKTIDPIENNKNIDFYPKSHWLAIDYAYKNNVTHNTSKYISIHVGRLPMNKCADHMPVNRGAIGLVSLKKAKENGCTLSSAPHSTAGRDHLFLIEENKILTKDWIFVYEKIEHMMDFDVKNINFIKKDLFNKVCVIIDDLLMKIEALCVK